MSTNKRNSQKGYNSILKKKCLKFYKKFEKKLKINRYFEKLQKLNNKE